MCGVTINGSLNDMLVDGANYSKSKSKADPTLSYCSTWTDMLPLY